MDVGEVWAYRKPNSGPVTPVRVLRIGSKRPPRVLVRFTDEEFEGREEWVPPGRLRVAWDDASAWLAREQRWEALQAAADEVWDDDVNRAAHEVLAALPEHLPISLGWRKPVRDLTLIRDLPTVTAELGLTTEELLAKPLAFIDDEGTYIAPWQVGVELAQLAAPVYAEAILRQLDQDEADDRREALHGYVIPRRKGEDIVISPDICARTTEQFRPGRDLARQWCEVEALDRYDELAALRTEVVRLSRLIEEVLSALDDADRHDTAEYLRRKLGVPVAALLSGGQE